MFIKQQPASAGIMFPCLLPDLVIYYQETFDGRNCIDLKGVSVSPSKMGVSCSSFECWMMQLREAAQAYP